MREHLHTRGVSNAKNVPRSRSTICIVLIATPTYELTFNAMSSLRHLGLRTPPNVAWHLGLRSPPIYAHSALLPIAFTWFNNPLSKAWFNSSNPLRRWRCTQRSRRKGNITCKGKDHRMETMKPSPHKFASPLRPNTDMGTTMIPSRSISAPSRSNSTCH